MKKNLIYFETIDKPFLSKSKIKGWQYWFLNFYNISLTHFSRNQKGLWLPFHKHIWSISLNFHCLRPWLRTRRCSRKKILRQKTNSQSLTNINKSYSWKSSLLVASSYLLVFWRFFDWRFFGFELRDFGCWKGVVLVWNRCVELRGSMWKWGVLVQYRETHFWRRRRKMGISSTDTARRLLDSQPN